MALGPCTAGLCSAALIGPSAAIHGSSATTTLTFLLRKQIQETLASDSMDSSAFKQQCHDRQCQLFC